MTKITYAVTHEMWEIGGIHDWNIYVPTKEDFLDLAHDNPSGSDYDETIAEYDNKIEALEKLKQYKCTYEPFKNYNLAEYDLYYVEERIYEFYEEDNEWDLEDAQIIEYAMIEL